jgi:hypothetical protein
MKVAHLPAMFRESWHLLVASTLLVILYVWSIDGVSRVKVALRRENSRPWHEVEADFLECEYRAVRDRQMKELEMEDDLLNKVPVR